jgi:hypothetical protein
MNCWAKKGVLDQVFAKLQQEQILRLKIEAFSLDSTSVKVHPDGTGALKNGPQALGKSRGGWNTKVHLVAANARTAIIFCLSPGEAHDAPLGRQLLLELGPLPGRSSAGHGPSLREGRNPATGTGIEHDPGRTAQVKPTRTLGLRSRTLQEAQSGGARVPTIEKASAGSSRASERLDVVFLAFIYFALIIEALRSCEHALIDHS